MTRFKSWAYKCGCALGNLCRRLLKAFHFEVLGRRKFKGTNGHKAAYIIIIADLLLAIFSFMSFLNATDLVFITNGTIFVKNAFTFKRESRILEDEYYEKTGYKVTRGQRSPYDRLQNVSVIIIVILGIVFVALAWINAQSTGATIIQILRSLVALFTTIFTLITNSILDLSKIYVTKATFTSEDLSERM